MVLFRKRLLVVVSLAALLSLGRAMGGVPFAAAQGKPWSGASIVRDPEWQKSFLGSYGFLSGAEPDIKPSEIEVL